ncbi:hypothetical protein [Evansella tamaricis]|uniref:Uncharacterized protein n=1 Tax=Evansella tamaricis TaxID=2069301 RepID=A0ABS6JGA5_9BACI|nr:hypothetical protein [Evansella tamaricis]MBU9711368.1 hypothetical protein [Evansella tamaricis]
MKKPTVQVIDLRKVDLNWESGIRNEHLPKTLLSKAPKDAMELRQMLAVSSSGGMKMVDQLKANR